MEAIGSFEMSVHTRSAWRHIPEDDILQNYPISRAIADSLPGLSLFLKTLKQGKILRKDDVINLL
jgi:hypothetical protein